MAVQAQLFGTGNTGFDLFPGSGWTRDGYYGNNGVFDQLCLDHQQKQQVRTNQSLQTQIPESAEYFDQIINDHMEKQRLELDCYVRSENDRLRIALQEQRKQHVVNLLQKIEFKASLLLRQKQETILKTSERTVELEAMLKRLQTENAIWRKMAMDSEAAVVSLNAKLQELQEKFASVSGCNENVAEDAESCCEDNGGQETELQNRAMAYCRGCKIRQACVLFLPCRHLCSCIDCVAFLEFCPVCRMCKKASIEALIF